MTRANVAVSTPLSTITRRPPVSTISIRPGATTAHVRMASSPPLRTVRIRRETARQRLAADHRLRKRRAVVGLDQALLSGQPAPREQLAGRQPIPPRRRRNLPPAIVALGYNPALLCQRPTTPGARLNDLKPRHLRARRSSTSPSRQNHLYVLPLPGAPYERAHSFKKAV
jgi:hypothetical protein